MEYLLLCECMSKGIMAGLWNSLAVHPMSFMLWGSGLLVFFWVLRRA